MARYVVKRTGRVSDDCDITDPDGAEAFHYVDHVISSPNGDGQVRIVRHHGFHLRADIHRGGIDIATVHEMTGREKHAKGRGHGLRLATTVAGAADVQITGDPVFGTTTFSQDGHLVARMAPTLSWWRGLSGTFGLEVEPGQDDIVLLAIAIAVEWIARSRQPTL